MTDAKEALWGACDKPKGMTIWFIELAYGFISGRISYRVLLASNGKIYRVSAPVRDQDNETWEGYVA